MHHFFKNHLASSLTLLALCFSGPMGLANVQAQGAAAGGAPAHAKASGVPEKTADGTWDGLKPNQQAILAPLESDWDYLNPESRKRWIQVANLYPKMSEQEQQRLQSRMTSWSNLSQKDRRLARENYLASLKFPADKKVEAWSAYQKLSEEQKKKLAKLEEKKKKPNAVTSPTLIQHPVTQKSDIVIKAPRTPVNSGTNSSEASGESSSNPNPQ